MLKRLSYKDNKVETLEIINSDLYSGFLHDDPVRPSIPISVRISNNKIAFALTDLDDGNVHAVVCVAFTDKVLTEESEVYEDCKDPSVAMFYTVWSYSRGAGRTIILEVRDYIQKNMPHIKRFVTLSPKTDMARKFHLRNGATELQVNETTVNFEY